MNLDEYTSYDALGLAELVRRKEVTPYELRAVALLANNAVNGEINAVLETWDDEEIAENPSMPGPFYGVPFLVKDLGSGPIDLN